MQPMDAVGEFVDTVPLGSGKRPAPRDSFRRG